MSITYSPIRDATLQETPMSHVISHRIAAIGLVISVLPITAYGLTPCSIRPCDTQISCEKAADWVVEGVFTLNLNTIWLEDAVLIRGDYPVPQRTTYLEDASSCWRALPRLPRADTARHLIGKRVRAYGTSKPEPFVTRGVIFLEVLPSAP